MLPKNWGVCLLLQIFAILYIADALETFDEKQVDFVPNKLQALRERFEHIKFDVDKLKETIKNQKLTDKEVAIILNKMVAYGAELKEIQKLVNGTGKAT